MLEGGQNESDGGLPAVQAWVVKQRPARAAGVLHELRTLAGTPEACLSWAADAEALLPEPASKCWL